MEKTRCFGVVLVLLFLLDKSKGQRQILRETSTERTSPCLRHTSERRKVLFYARWSNITHGKHHSTISEGEIWTSIYSQGSMAPKFPRLQSFGLFLLGCREAKGLRGPPRTIFEPGWTQETNSTGLERRMWRGNFEKSHHAVSSQIEGCGERKLWTN